jgi:hypothetical protein
MLNANRTLFHTGTASSAGPELILLNGFSNERRYLLEICFLYSGSQDLRPPGVEMILQIIDQFLRRERLFGQMSRTVVLTSAASDTGIQIDKLFLAEFFDLRYSETLCILVFEIHKGQVSSGLMGAEQNIDRRADEMEKLGIGDVSNETDHKKKVDPECKIS